MLMLIACLLLLCLARPAAAKKGGSKKQVIGYSYYMAAIFGLCLRATNLLKVVYGERIAWEGSLSGMSGSVTYIAVNASPTTYGMITVMANGNYSYTLDTQNEAVKALHFGETLDDAYSYSATHTSGQTLPGKLAISIAMQRFDVWDPDARDGAGGYVAHYAPTATPASGTLPRPSFADTPEGVSEGGFRIEKRDLFGGDANGGSGGLEGEWYFATGHAGQYPNWIMQKYLGPDCPAHRGIVTLSMDKNYVASFSPQFRPLRCLVQNIGGYGWYPDKAVIAGTQINPAHEIRDALINPDLAGQYSPADIDEVSFAAAADTLYAEQFGLSPKWDDTGKAQDYIQSLLTHIDGVLVRDRATGRLRLKLLRGGYDAAALPVIGPDSFSALKSLGTIAVASMVNKVTIKYARLTDIGEETATITAENQANIQLQGVVNSATLDFPHLTNAIADLPGRILARELRARCYPLRSLVIEGKSTLSALQEGDLFVLHFPERGIERLVCRVLVADYGTVDDQLVRLTCTEDIYGVEQISIVTPPETEWSPTTGLPGVPRTFMALEMPWHIALQLTGYTAAQLAGDYALSGLMLTLASRNTPQEYGYRHAVQTQNGWEFKGEGSYCASVPIQSALDRFGIEIRVTDTASLPLRLGDLAFLGAEIVQITGWSNQLIVVNRGVLDTLPQPHQRGVTLWLPSNTGGGFLEQLYTKGETARCVLASYGSNGEVTPTADKLVSLPMNARFGRPYPPADLHINGEQLPNIISGALVLSWKHRDRIEQQDSVVAQNAANIGPEPGTTYTVQIYDRTNKLIRTAAGITGTNWTWDTERLDCGGTLQTKTRLTLAAVRDNLESWQRWDVIVNRVVPENLFLGGITAQTATFDGVSASLSADGVVTLNGTVNTPGAINIKLTRTMEIAAGTGRPASWDADSLSLPASPLTLTAEILSGTFSVTQADSLNLTLRYSAANLCLNTKIGDGILETSGTPSGALRMVVLYARQGTVFSNLKLYVGIYA